MNTLKDIAAIVLMAAVFAVIEWGLLFGEVPWRMQ